MKALKGPQREALPISELKSSSVPKKNDFQEVLPLRPSSSLPRGVCTGKLSYSCISCHMSSMKRGWNERIAQSITIYLHPHVLTVQLKPNLAMRCLAKTILEDHSWHPVEACTPELQPSKPSATGGTAHHCWTALRASPSAIGNSQIRTLKASWPTGDSVTSSSHSMTRSTGAPVVRVFLVQTQQGQVLQTLSSFFLLSRCFDRVPRISMLQYWISLHSWISMLHMEKQLSTAGSKLLESQRKFGGTFHISWLSQSPVSHHTFCASYYKLEPRLVSIRLISIHIDLEDMLESSKSAMLSIFVALK